MEMESGSKARNNGRVPRMPKSIDDSSQAKNMLEQPKEEKR
jgi:hypothetical protein